MKEKDDELKNLKDKIAEFELDINKNSNNRGRKRVNNK